MQIGGGGPNRNRQVKQISSCLSDGFYGVKPVKNHGFPDMSTRCLVNYESTTLEKVWYEIEVDQQSISNIVDMYTILAGILRTSSDRLKTET